MDSESAALLAEYLRGNDAAATQIFDRYTTRLIALTQSRLSPMLQARFDPDDVVQSAYRSFFRKARSAEISLQRSGDLWRTLAAFALNKARSRVEMELAQMRDPRRETGDPDWLDVLESDATPEDAAILVEQLTSFMAGLKPRDRRILELRLRGETVDAIVEDLANPGSDPTAVPASVSAATVRRVLREAEHALRRALFDNGDNPR
jgi:RNA polymerase sigma-70 factor (ECF subfamily)